MALRDTCEPALPTTQKLEFSAAEIGALAHLYRGEVYRSTVWRTRLELPFVVAAAFSAVVAMGLCALVVAVEAQVSRVIPVGGTQIAIRVFGSSGPSILFEAGLGEDASSFTPLAQQLSRCATAVLYDRPGTGKSGPRAGDIVLAATVADERAGIAPPFVLVGHSLGGLYVQAYARSRPDKVAAVVLIDATSPLRAAGRVCFNRAAEARHGCRCGGGRRRRGAGADCHGNAPRPSLRAHRAALPGAGEF